MIDIINKYPSISIPIIILVFIAIGYFVLRKVR
jgi:uncharacterized protein YneF (UPF0154 family)